MEQEFQRELDLLKSQGLRTNPLRLEYECHVRKLQHDKEHLLAEAYSLEDIARLLHSKRRELGKRYKDAAPPLFREYILYATKAKYGDPLGPDYETLRKEKTPEQIIESATRPIQNLDDRLTIAGFIEWFDNVYQKQFMGH